MKQSDTSIINQTFLGFGLIIVLFCFVGIVSWVGINSLGDLTSTIYKHPLEVSNAALRASMGVVKMHRSMKDVVLADEQLPLDKAVNYVAEEEKIVVNKLDLIQEKILGIDGQTLANETRKLFFKWQPIREEVTTFAKNGDKKNAARVTKGKGASHEALLEQKMLALTSYARKKADGFIEQANKVGNRITFIINLSVAFGLFLSLIIAFFTVRKIREALFIRDKAEEELKIQKRLLDRSQEIAHLGSWHLDIKKNILTWSDEAFRIFKRTPLEFGATYEAFLETIHPEDREMVDKTYTSAMKNNLPYECIHRIIRDEGEVRMVLEKSENVIDENGVVIHSYGFTQDITEQKLAEKEREEMISKLKKSLDEINTLRGILPICSFCKNIRNDKGYYEQIEGYIHKHTGVDFSHTICTPCMEKHYPEEYENIVFKKS